MSTIQAEVYAALTAHYDRGGGELTPHQVSEMVARPQSAVDTALARLYDRGDIIATMVSEFEAPDSIIGVR
jgi:predicted transcriptional regulator